MRVKKDVTLTLALTESPNPDADSFLTIHSLSYWEQERDEFRGKGGFWLMIFFTKHT